MKTFISMRFSKEPLCEPPLMKLNNDKFGTGTPYWSNTAFLSVSDLQENKTFSIMSDGLSREQVKSVLTILDMNILKIV